MRGPGVVWPGSEPQLRLMHRRGTWCALRVVSVRILTGPARDWAMRVGEPAAAAHAPTPCLVRRCSWRPICVSYHPQQPPTDRPTRWWVPRLHGTLAPPPLHRPGRPRPFPTGLRAMLRCCDLPKIRPLHPKIRPLHDRYVLHAHGSTGRDRDRGRHAARGGAGAALAPPTCNARTQHHQGRAIWPLSSLGFALWPLIITQYIFKRARTDLRPRNETPTVRV